MAGKRSNNKGATYERRIAGKFSDWSGIELVRTPSGAPEEIYADIWPRLTTEYFPIALECKCDESWNFDQIMCGTGPFMEWLEQACRQAENATKELRRQYIPMLVFSKNRCPDYVAVSALYSPLTIQMDVRHLSLLAHDYWFEVYELQAYLDARSYASIFSSLGFAPISMSMEDDERTAI